MAHVYAGDLGRVDHDVLSAIERLPDDFWAFAEFNIERNVDWLIIREVPPSERGNRPSTMMMTELKRESRPLRALSMNGPWEKMGDVGSWEEAHTGGPDFNYYQQVVKTSNVLQEWLWRNQRLFMEMGGNTVLRPQDDFKPWPDLLILSPPGTMHQLPIRPPTGFGGFWFDLDKWAYHVMTWNPRGGYSFSAGELAKLAEILGLHPIGSPQRNHVEPAPATTPETVKDFMSWLLSLEQRIAQLEAHQGNHMTTVENPGGLSTLAKAPKNGRASRPLSDEEKDSLRRAVDTIRAYDRNRTIPSVLDELNIVLGYNLRDTMYNGFGSARNMLDQARSEGVIQFGPYRGPNPTIYLPEEEVPAW